MSKVDSSLVHSVDDHLQPFVHSHWAFVHIDWNCFSHWHSWKVPRTPPGLHASLQLELLQSLTQLKGSQNSSWPTCIITTGTASVTDTAERFPELLLAYMHHYNKQFTIKRLYHASRMINCSCIAAFQIQRAETFFEILSSQPFLRHFTTRTILIRAITSVIQTCMKTSHDHNMYENCVFLAGTCTLGLFLPHTLVSRYLWPGLWYQQKQIMTSDRPCWRRQRLNSWFSTASAESEPQNGELCTRATQITKRTASSYWYPSLLSKTAGLHFQNNISLTAEMVTKLQFIEFVTPAANLALKLKQNCSKTELRCIDTELASYLFSACTHIPSFLYFLVCNIYRFGKLYCILTTG